jgi:hypothetical protein
MIHKCKFCGRIRAVVKGAVFACFCGALIVAGEAPEPVVTNVVFVAPITAVTTSSATLMGVSVDFPIPIG